MTPRWKRLNWDVGQQKVGILAEIVEGQFKEARIAKGRNPLGMPICSKLFRSLVLLYLSCCFFLQKAYLHLVLGAKTKEGEDILVLNPSKIPSKREFTGKKEYSQVMDSLFL